MLHVNGYCPERLRNHPRGAIHILNERGYNMDDEVMNGSEEIITDNDSKIELSEPTTMRDTRIDLIIERITAIENAINEIVVPIRNISQKDIPPAATSEQARPARRYI